MDLSPDERRFLERARVGRLATADSRGRPNAVPVCFALTDSGVATPIDEKPKQAAASELRRVRDVEENPPVAVVVDRYDDDWSRLAWVQLRGRARLLDPGESGHRRAVDRLWRKYDQYADHDLDARPVIAVDVGGVRSWGDLPQATAEWSGY